MRQQVLKLVLIPLMLWGNHLSGQVKTDTFRVYFDLNIPELNKAARHKIDSLLYNDIINTNSYILIVGYADYLGSAASNDILSENRAKNTLAYLRQMGVDETHVQSCLGKGEIDRTVQSGEGYAADRKVDIIIGRSKAIYTKQPERPVIANKPTRKNPMSEIIDSLKPGQTFRLDRIYFHTGRHTVRDESITELDNLYYVMNDYPTLRIQIEGHVCCVPEDRDALDEDVVPGADNTPTPYELNKLSLNRAMFIYHYLVRKGIDANRMKYEGYGRSRPLVANEKTLADEDKNKRVEIRIISK